MIRCTWQDLEVQNIELVEVNEKLQKELGMLRGLAKEAILEKKKSQSAFEALKHQVVHLLGEHTRGAQQGAPKQDPAAQPSAGWLPVPFWAWFVLACACWYLARTISWNACKLLLLLSLGGQCTASRVVTYSLQKVVGLVLLIAVFPMDMRAHQCQLSYIVSVSDLCSTGVGKHPACCSLCRFQTY